MAPLSPSFQDREGRSPCISVDRSPWHILWYSHVYTCQTCVHRGRHVIRGTHFSFFLIECTHDMQGETCVSCVPCPHDMQGYHMICKGTLMTCWRAIDLLIWTPFHIWKRDRSTEDIHWICSISIWIWIWIFHMALPYDIFTEYIPYSNIFHIIHWIYSIFIWKRDRSHETWHTWRIWHTWHTWHTWEYDTHDTHETHDTHVSVSCLCLYLRLSLTWRLWCLWDTRQRHQKRHVRDSLR